MNANTRYLGLGADVQWTTEFLHAHGPVPAKEWDSVKSYYHEGLTPQQAVLAYVAKEVA